MLLFELENFCVFLCCHPIAHNCFDPTSKEFHRFLLLQSDRLAMMSPRQIQSEIHAGLVVVLPLETPKAVRTIGLIRRSGTLLTPGMQTLLQACRQVADEMTSENPVNKPNA